MQYKLHLAKKPLHTHTHTHIYIGVHKYWASMHGHNKWHDISAEQLSTYMNGLYTLRTQVWRIGGYVDFITVVCNLLCCMCARVYTSLPALPSCLASLPPSLLLTVAFFLCYYMLLVLVRTHLSNHGAVWPIAFENISNPDNILTAIVPY